MDEDRRSWRAFNCPGSGGRFYAASSAQQSMTPIPICVFLPFLYQKEMPLAAAERRSVSGHLSDTLCKKMGKITVETCEIEGLKVITPTVFGDERGYFMETYNYNDYKAAGIDQEFVQDNQSSSRKGVLRGLHFQIHFPQDKLVRVVSGEVFDVAVDLRPGSKTYGKWYGVLLSAENKKQFFIPKNFAHGFVVLSDYAEFAYKCTDFYHPNDEGGLAWNDPDIGVEWPIPEGMELILSEKDKKWGSFQDFQKK